MDTVWKIATVPTMLTTVFSGSCDGEIRGWNLTSRSLSWKTKAHDGFVRGLCVEPNGQRILSCGDDKAIRIWSLNEHLKNKSKPGYSKGDVTPVATFLTKGVLHDISCSF
eukprot:UN02815